MELPDIFYLPQGAGFKWQVAKDLPKNAASPHLPKTEDLFGDNITL
jgi:hypothetical protein